MRSPHGDWHFMAPSAQTMPPTNPRQIKPPPDNDKLSVDTIWTLTIDAVQKANSGHPGNQWRWRR
jgi:Transketolase, thiamine diphosphate binding domain